MLLIMLLLLLLSKFNPKVRPRTMRSKITCQDEEQVSLVRETKLEPTNPMLACDKEDCRAFNVSATGFISFYKDKMQTRVLDGAKSMIFEVFSSPALGCMPRGVNGLDFLESWLKIPLVP